jgi:nitric oxide dioxygenase
MASNPLSILGWVRGRRQAQANGAGPQLAVDTLEESYDLIQPKMAQVVDNMYERLFQVSPRTAKPFEGVDVQRQRQSVVNTLQILRDSLRDLDGLIPNIEELGARHATWGVGEADYAVMGPVLLEVMAAAADPYWKSEYTTAWAAAWEVLQSVMLQGASKAQPARA